MIIATVLCLVVISVMVYGFVSVARDERRQALHGRYPCPLCHHGWTHVVGEPCDDCEERLQG